MSLFKQNNLNIFISLLLFFLLFPSASKAQIGEKWWLKSSLVDTVDKLRFHTSLNYSFSNNNSAVKTSIHIGEGEIILRKNRITNVTSYSFNRMHIKMDFPLKLDYSEIAHYFTSYFDYDFAKIFYGQSGYIWEKDNLLLLQNRHTLYAGIGVKQKFFDKVKIKTLLAIGRLEQEYSIPVDDIDVITEPYYVSYLSLIYQYPVSQKLSFSGQAIYILNLTDIERFRYKIDFKIEIGLIKHVNLNLGYSYKYDKDSEQLGLFPITSLQNIGLKFSI